MTASLRLVKSSKWTGRCPLWYCSDDPGSSGPPVRGWYIHNREGNIKQLTHAGQVAHEIHRKMWMDWDIQDIGRYGWIGQYRYKVDPPPPSDKAAKRSPFGYSVVIVSRLIPQLVYVFLQ